MRTGPWDNHCHSISRRQSEITTASDLVAKASMKSSTITTQTHWDVLAQHQLCHQQNPGQLTNRHGWKMIQKLKATLYWLTRHTEQQPSLWYMNAAGAALTAAFCSGCWGALSASFSWHPHLSSGAAVPREDASSRGKEMTLHVNGVLIL